MSSSFRRLLVMNISANIIFIYIGIFVNLYIWEQQHKIADVAWFNFVLFLTWGIAYALGARLLRQRTIRFIFGLSAISSGIAFLLLSYLTLDSRFWWITIIGIPVGLMYGFYATAQNLTLALNGRGREFGHFFAVSGAIAQIVNVTVPLLSAQIIRMFGYSGSFILMLVLVVLMFIVSFFVPALSLADKLPLTSTPGDGWRWRKVFSTPSLRWLIPSCLAAGLFLMFQGMFALLFTFSISIDKFVIAALNTLYTLSTFAALFLYRKYEKSEWGWLRISIVLICSGFLLTLYPIAPILVLSNIMTTVGLFYFGATWNALHFRMISSHPPLQQANLLVWRENLLVVSRCVMLLLIIPIQSFSGSAYWLLLGGAILIAISVLFFQRKAEHAFNAESAVS